MNSVPSRPCLGLIGGLGVGAAIHYYRELAKAHELAGTPLEFVMVHADMQKVFKHVQAGEKEQLAAYLAERIGRLRAAGANVAAIPAVMPHFCIRELIPISPLPLVNMLKTVADEIRSRGLERVALFGTRFTIESELFGYLNGVDVVALKPEEVEYVHSIYFALASKGNGTQEQRAGLSKLAHEILARDKVDAIVLAGTDLCSLFDELNTDFPAIDCASVHIRALAARASVPKSRDVAR